MAGLWILNFSHPLSAEHKKSIRDLTGQRISKVIDLKCQLDPQRSFVEQVQDLLDHVPLKPDEWQTRPLLVNPPSFAPIACILLAEVHGRIGYFPTILRMRPRTDSPTQFEVAEIINLQQVREEARQKRFIEQTD